MIERDGAKMKTIIAALSAVAQFTPEYLQEANEEISILAVAGLVSKYPPLQKFSEYLEFLRTTGGAHIHNNDFSLGIYGFGGYVVPSFDEGGFLDAQRHFQFGEVLYHTVRKDFIFAFDFECESDFVFGAPLHSANYARCANSFIELLSQFASGHYPIVGKAE